MGIYVNPDYCNFQRTLSREIYVDKTMMIETINHFIDHDNAFICVSRPRRSGKTIAANMLCAYYSKGCDAKQLFAPLKIGQTIGFERKLNQYNVIQIDLNAEFSMAMDPAHFLEEMTQAINLELSRAFPDASITEHTPLARSLLQIYARTHESFIIIIDEYDVLIREQTGNALFSKYLRFLNSLFKNDTLRPAIALAYLTGILPIIRDKVQSKLNLFKEYSFLDSGELAEFAGFTSEEVAALCKTYHMDFSECRRWYNGYHQHGFELYTPQTVAFAMERRKYDSYWGKTSSYEAITDRIRMDFAGTKDAVIRMLAGESVPVNVSTYLNTMDSFKVRDDLFTYLIHLGYLAYDQGSIGTETCHIPNHEIRLEWENAIRVCEGYETTAQIIESSRQLLEDTLAGNTNAVAKALDESHIHATANRSYHNEDALQCAIYLSYIFALNSYTVVREMTAGKGFADMVYIPIQPQDPALIIELKRNSSAGRALAQIREKRYFDSLTHYQGKLLFVRIDYDEEEKTHTCRIEWFAKR